MALISEVPNEELVETQRDPLTGKDKYTGFANPRWWQWFSELRDRSNVSSFRRVTKRFTGLSAALGATSLPIGSVEAGLYRITVRTRITTAATVSSSLTPTVGWTEATLSVTESGPAYTGNSTTAPHTLTVLARVDGQSPVTVSTAYASVGATGMVYELEAVVEQVPSS